MIKKIFKDPHKYLTVENKDHFLTYLNQTSFKNEDIDTLYKMKEFLLHTERYELIQELDDKINELNEYFLNQLI